MFAFMKENTSSLSREELRIRKKFRKQEAIEAERVDLGYCSRELRGWAKPTKKGTYGYGM